jgi:hypothetical protein
MAVGWPLGLISLLRCAFFFWGHIIAVSAVAHAILTKSRRHYSQMPFKTAPAGLAQPLTQFPVFAGKLLAKKFSLGYNGVLA